MLGKHGESGGAGFSAKRPAFDGSVVNDVTESSSNKNWSETKKGEKPTSKAGSGEQRPQ